ncbi:MAG: thiol reductant ABC exporter subunit CydC [Devosia sp.]
MRSLLYFLPLLQRLRGPLVLSLTLSIVTLAAGIGLLGLSGWFLTAAALSTAGSAFNLFGPSAGVRGLSFVRIMSRYGEKLAGHDATLKLLSNLRTWLFRHLFQLVPVDRRFGRGDLVSRLTADLEALDIMFLVALGPMLAAVATGTGMTVMLSFMLPPAAGFYATGFAIAVVAVPIALVAASRRAGAKAVAASAQLRLAVMDGLDGHRDLLLFGAVDEVISRSADAGTQLAAAKLELGNFGVIASAVVQLLAGAILVATLLCGLAALEAGRMEGPLLVGLLLAVLASFEVFAVLVRSATRLAGAAAAAERLEAVAKAPVEICEPAKAVPLPMGGDVAFDRVTFGYDGRNTLLKDVNLAIRSGECVAIRGASGSGKSSLAKLLVRLVAPQRGFVRVNGCDIGSVATAELRERIALMTQDAPVFHDSIRANLLIGRPNAIDTELWQVLKTVRLSEVVAALPGRLDTILSEAGQSFSAGQARRICLARTLLSPASIIVLDEPTSGLDAETGGGFLSELPDVAAGRTMIVITHADLPASFSRILTVKAGVVSER